MSLLEKLRAAQAVSEQAKQQVPVSKSGLGSDMVVELEGVNAPEFTGRVNASMIEQDEVEEVSTGAQDLFSLELGDLAESLNDVELPAQEVLFDNGDEDEIPLTSEHAGFQSAEPTENDLSDIIDEWEFEPEAESDSESVDVAETEEEDDSEEEASSDSWALLSLSDPALGFSTRTINALNNAGYQNLLSIKGKSIQELLELKGFGKTSFTEVTAYLATKGVSDWLVEVKPSRAKAKNEMVSTGASLFGGGATPVVEAVVEAVVAPVVEAGVAPVVEAGVAQKASGGGVGLKTLVLGAGVVKSSKGVVKSFEEVYDTVIKQICEQGGYPSLSAFEFGKGWGYLATAVRRSGWPEGVDILVLSKSYMSRADILMELQLLADIVIEG